MTQYMRNQRCINGTLEGGYYSAPVPIIGLYTAGASLACMLMMLYDIIAGLRAKKRWLPCKSFSLNSLTLSLLSIVAKVPVDLTTTMPSPIDQLSKLSGTTLVVIAMGFVFPSLANRKKSDWISNMAALSIFVITVIVNICIQISTGIIVLFIPEHTIIMFGMLSLLIWMLASFRVLSMDRKHIYLKGEKNDSLFLGLKEFYAKAYQDSSQYAMCVRPILANLTAVCLICSVTLAQAVVRAVVLKQLDFCLGSSDYGWSMKLIVISQIITVIIGCFVTTFRWLSLYTLHPFFFNPCGGSIFLEARTKLLGLFTGHLEFLVSYFVLLPLIWLAELVWYFPKCIMHILGTLVSYLVSFGFKITIDESLDFSISIHDDKWLILERIEKMNRFIATSNWRPPPEDLRGLLTRITQSPQLGVRHIGSQSLYPILRKENVSYFQLLALVCLARASIPKHICETLIDAYFDLINILSLLRGNKLFTSEETSFVHHMPDVHFNKSSSELDQAIELMINPGNWSYELSRNIYDELGIITAVINPSSYTSMDDLYAGMEQLFVDLAHALLEQLPNHIYRMLDEELIESMESKIEVALKVLSRAGLIEAHIQWSFPEGSNFSRLITPKPPERESKIEGGNSVV